MITSHWCLLRVGHLNKLVSWDVRVSEVMRQSFPSGGSGDRETSRSDIVGRGWIHNQVTWADERSGAWCMRTYLKYYHLLSWNNLRQLHKTDCAATADIHEFYVSYQLKRITNHAQGWIVIVAFADMPSDMFEWPICHATVMHYNNFTYLFIFPKLDLNLNSTRTHDGHSRDRQTTVKN